MIPVIPVCDMVKWNLNLHYRFAPAVLEKQLHRFSASCAPILTLRGLSAARRSSPVLQSCYPLRSAFASVTVDLP
jgi:hypothetical protein